MGWTDPHRQLLYRELAAAQGIEPRRDEIPSLMALLGQREIRDSKCVITSVLWRIDQWLLRGASLAWTATEFETIATCLYDLDAFDTLVAYAREAMRRDQDAKVACFYRIAAHAKGDSDRLSQTQAKKLFELLDDADARHDLQLASRIRRFLEGGAGTRRAAMIGGVSEKFGPLDMARPLDQAATGATRLPEKEVRKMVKEFGHSRAIEMLADLMVGSPLGDMLTDQEIALLCGVLVTRAVEGHRRATQR